MTGGIKIVCEANLSSLGGLSEGMEDMYSLDKMTYSEPVKRNYVNLDTGGWAGGVTTRGPGIGPYLMTSVTLDT